MPPIAPRGDHEVLGGEQPIARLVRLVELLQDALQVRVVDLLYATKISIVSIYYP